MVSELASAGRIGHQLRGVCCSVELVTCISPFKNRALYDDLSYSSYWLTKLLSSFKENPQEKIHERLDDHDGEQEKGIFHLI